LALELNELRDVGLTEYETMAYLVLVKTGGLITSAVSRNTENFENL
jgi:sugar-specific transcriptional regulator TrmB